MLRETKKSVKKGTVTKLTSAHTAIVEVKSTKPHKLYLKVLRLSKKYNLHYTSDLNVGDKVTISSCRPMSNSKRWRVSNNTTTEKK